MAGEQARGEHKGGAAAPNAAGRVLAAFVVLLVGLAVYLIAVRREALLVDLAGLSGMLFCF